MSAVAGSGGLPDAPPPQQPQPQQQPPALSGNQAALSAPQSSSGVFGHHGNAAESDAPIAAQDAPLAAAHAALTCAHARLLAAIANREYDEL